eukprot:1966516-Pyramimonas_sp.AAC.1
MKLSCDGACASADGACCLTWGTFQLLPHTCACYTIPTLRMEDTATLKPPYLDLICNLFKAYTAVTEVSSICYDGDLSPPLKTPKMT